MIKQSDRPTFFPTQRRPLTSRAATAPLQASPSDFPIVLQCPDASCEFTRWLADHEASIRAFLLESGAVLFRGFEVRDPEGFERFARALYPDLLQYVERAATRRKIGRGIFSSTELHASQRIPLHHELSYSHRWPGVLLFCCVTPAQSGGDTPLARERLVTRALAPAIVDEFQRRGVRYVRNYSPQLDPWQTVFQTTRREDVEMYCREAGMQFEWLEGGRLRTAQVRPAMVTHPVTGETLWFNHAHMFHVSNLEHDLRQKLLSEFGEAMLPRNSYFGDGGSIDDCILDEIRSTYMRNAVCIPWRRGDVLLLDNFLVAHGRMPYQGERLVMVAMAEPQT